MTQARLLITGTREGWDKEHLAAVLKDHYYRLANGGRRVVLVHGAADGVDTQAAEIWEAHGLVCDPHPADWAKGKWAGPARNSLMVSLGADQCIAFLIPNSKGTLDCLLKASQAGIPTEVYGRRR